MSGQCHVRSDPTRPRITQTGRWVGRPSNGAHITVAGRGFMLDPGWAKVKILIEELHKRGPERCAYGVSIDTARRPRFVRASLPSQAFVFQCLKHGLRQCPCPVGPAVVALVAELHSKILGKHSCEDFTSTQSRSWPEVLPPADTLSSLERTPSFAPPSRSLLSSPTTA